MSKENINFNLEKYKPTRLIFIVRLCSWKEAERELYPRQPLKNLWALNWISLTSAGEEYF